MITIATIQQLAWRFTERTLFHNFSTTIAAGARIGIVGNNGSGKSTLLALLAEELQPTEGSITWHNNCLLQFVPQEVANFSANTMRTQELALLTQLHVPNIPYAQLSGGEKLKRRLAYALSKPSDVLLLDEPTNHLDENSIAQLLELLKNYRGTIITVSHDRFFLDQIATQIWALENESITVYNGNYSAYSAQWQQAKQAQQKRYEVQQQKRETIEAQMNNLTNWADKAHRESTKKEGFKEFYRVKAKRTDSQIKSKRKLLAKELAKNPVTEAKPEKVPQWQIQSSTATGKRLLQLTDVTLQYDEKILLQHAFAQAQFGDKIAITGANGSGKTTLLRAILAQHVTAGEIWLAKSAKIGYLSQDVFDLPLTKTPSEIFYQDNFTDRGKVQTLMQHLGFSAQQWQEPIANMSMGERVKCKLMLYILEERNVLLLDEPTNHLDMTSRQQLENTLQQYEGSLFIVSHDRYFLQATTQKEWQISNYTLLDADEKVIPIVDNYEQQRLTLENERQDILGKLSFLTPKHKDYATLDKKFNDLTKQINALK